jgi:ribonucleoside-triphosphate reductase
MQDLKVITSQERISPFNRAKIAQALIRETQELAPRFFNKPGLTQSEAESVALSAEKTLRTMPYPWLTAPLIREVVNAELLLRGHIIHRNILSRVGTPIYDACMMDVGKGKEDKENANLQDNAETSHKKKADRMSKEQYLLLLPPQLSQRHLEGDLHIHDLEYFGTSPSARTMISGTSSIMV